MNWSEVHIRNRLYGFCFRYEVGGRLSTECRGSLRWAGVQSGGESKSKGSFGVSVHEFLVEHSCPIS